MLTKSDCGTTKQWLVVGTRATGERVILLEADTRALAAAELPRLKAYLDGYVRMQVEHLTRRPSEIGKQG